MDAFAERFSRAKRSEGLPLGGTRIGVHAGRVLVGNFGGSTMLDYRALGDPINTAARLESVNKQLGTRVCVSGEVTRGVPGFEGRPVGGLVLKGKTETIEAFEPLAALADGACPPEEYRAAFDVLAAREPGARDRFAALHERFPGDGLVAFHLARLERGEDGARVRLFEK
jgi:adenylate cyclase